MITAILAEQLAKTLRVITWILFFTLLLSYTYINIEMVKAHKVEKEKDDLRISKLTDVDQELLQIIKSPNFAKNPETSSKIEKIEKKLTAIASPPKSSLRFMFWPVNTNKKIVDKVSVPIENGVVSVDFSVKNISEVPATKGTLWIQICNGCRFVEEPQGSEMIQPYDMAVRRKHFDLILAGVYLEPTTLKIAPPLGFNSFTLSFKYTCETCPPVDNEHSQKLTVSY